eukprot:335038-Rhodomonas_salina.2
MAEEEQTARSRQEEGLRCGGGAGRHWVGARFRNIARIVHRLSTTFFFSRGKMLKASTSSKAISECDPNGSEKCAQRCTVPQLPIPNSVSQWKLSLHTSRQRDFDFY